MHSVLVILLVQLLIVRDSLAATTAPPQTPLTGSIESEESEQYGLNGRIVNGKKASLRQFPHQASLRRSITLSHFCGGSIITEYHILTAGHCMYLDEEKIQPWTIVAVAGDLQLSKPSSTGQKKAAEKYVLHPKFDYYTLQNDIAIVKLKVPFTLNMEVARAPISLTPPMPNTFCQISGWGYPDETIPIVNNHLMYLDIPILPIEKCREVLANVSYISPGMFCAGYLEGGKDACRGDSGGPMSCNDVIIGIISGGEGCARPSRPGVYTDVAFYAGWILEHTAMFLR